MQLFRFAKIYGILCLPISFQDYLVVYVVSKEGHFSLKHPGYSALGSWEVRRKGGSDSV